MAKAPPPQGAVDAPGEDGRKRFHAQPLEDLAGIMRSRGWRCNRAADEGRPATEIALLLPPDGRSAVEAVLITDPAAVDVPAAIADAIDGPFFAIWKHPTRPLAPVTDAERAANAIEHITGHRRATLMASPSGGEACDH
jgi:hypothetical protein